SHRLTFQADTERIILERLTESLKKYNRLRPVVEEESQVVYEAVNPMGHADKSRLRLVCPADS
ncbi:MAG: hypothetical protein ABI822_12550, partial [Bryobacteraceae bacterium]